jgi:hypothetical protein
MSCAIHANNSLSLPFSKNVARLQIILSECALPSISAYLMKKRGNTKKTKFYKRMIKELLNSVLAKYRNLSMARRFVRHRQTLRNFAQPKDQ